MDSGAIRNVLFEDFTNNLSIVLKETHKSIRVATGVTSQVVGILKEVLVAFGDLLVSVDLLVVEVSPFDLIIGDYTMEDLGVIIHLGKRKVPLMKGNNTIALPLIPDYMREKPVTEDTDTCQC